LDEFTVAPRQIYLKSAACAEAGDVAVIRSSFGACWNMKKWGCAFVRTTIELPDPLFREVKATAARQGMRLKDYVTEALQDKLAKRPTHAEKPWMKFAGIVANDPEMVAELRRIEQIVEENFEQIEEEKWK